jgi:hypothetical protein
MATKDLSTPDDGSFCALSMIHRFALPAIGCKYQIA